MAIEALYTGNTGALVMMSQMMNASMYSAGIGNNGTGYGAGGGGGFGMGMGGMGSYGMGMGMNGYGGGVGHYGMGGMGGAYGNGYAGSQGSITNFTTQNAPLGTGLNNNAPQQGQDQTGMY